MEHHKSSPCKHSVTLPVIKQNTLVSDAMRLIDSVERSRLTQQQSTLLALLPVTVIQGLLAHD